MFVPATFGGGEREWEAFSLILPAVSVGNVGQLAVDLLINTISAERVGYLYDDSILPMVGNDPYFAGTGGSACSLATACDVYCSSEHKVVIVQQRAQFIKGKRKQFREKLLSWVRQENFRLVVLLGSSYSQLRRDRQICGSQFRFLLTSKLMPLHKDELVGKLKWTELEKEAADFDAAGTLELHIPGGGIAKTLYDDCEAAGLPLAVVLMFCSEGDNSLDAIELATFANQWLHLVPMRETKKESSGRSNIWKLPESWCLNFGSGANKTLYN